MTDQQKIIELETIIFMLLSAFPDETIKTQQRFRQRQVELVNGCIVKAKAYTAAPSQA